MGPFRPLLKVGVTRRDIEWRQRAWIHYDWDPEWVHWRQSSRTDKLRVSECGYKGRTLLIYWRMRRCLLEEKNSKGAPRMAAWTSQHRQVFLHRANGRDFLHAAVQLQTKLLYYGSKIRGHELGCVALHFTWVWCQVCLCRWSFCKHEAAFRRKRCPGID